MATRKRLLKTTLRIIGFVKTHFSYITHISRKYYRIIAVTILIVLSIYSLITFFPNIQLLREFNQIRIDLIKDPSNPLLHIKMAEIFKQANDLEKAKEEYFLALRNSKNPTDIKQALEEIKNLQEEPVKIKQQIQDWEKVVQEKPGYRDAYFQLAVLNWQIYENKEALSSLNKTLELDPNFEPAKELRKIFTLL